MMDTKDFTLKQPNDSTPWRLVTPPKASREWAVLWLQGFTSTIEGHTEGLLRLAERTSITFAMLNYAGHGTHPVSLSEATRQQQLTEVSGVYDELTKLGYKKIIVIGGSFGAYMAALLVAKRELAGLVLRAPAIYIDDEFELPYSQTRSGKTEERTDIWREKITADTPSQALAAVKAYGGDVFVIEHELDSVVNAAVPRAYATVAQHPNYIVIRGCDHSPKLMPDPEKYFAIIENWLTTIVINLQKTASDDA